jgi:carbon-monoxide dehydrogenase iron sulfur subunit
MLEKVLVLDPEKCIGCRTCELVCSLKHSQGCSESRSRVRIVTQKTQDASMPIMCQQCEKPPCQDVCPTKATYRDPKTHAMIIDSSRCIGCQMCIMVCPFGAPSFDPIGRVTIKCDLCGGDPECAKLCPTETIKFMRSDKQAILRKRIGLEKLFKAIASLS